MVVFSVVFQNKLQLSSERLIIHFGSVSEVLFSGREESRSRHGNILVTQYNQGYHGSKGNSAYILLAMYGPAAVP